MPLGTEVSWTIIAFVVRHYLTTKDYGAQVIQSDALNAAALSGFSRYKFTYRAATQIKQGIAND